MYVCVCVRTGQRAEKVMDLVNGEEQPFGFFIVQSSLLCDDQQSSLTVHPMTGTLAPKDRSVTLAHNIFIYLFVLISMYPIYVEMLVFYGETPHAAHDNSDKSKCSQYTKN